MADGLKAFMVGLVSDVDKLSAFIANPREAAEKAGLSEEDREALFSGDQARIYYAVTGTTPPPPQEQPPQPAPQPPAQQPYAGGQSFAPGYGWPAQQGGYATASYGQPGYGQPQLVGYYVWPAYPQPYQ